MKPRLLKPTHALVRSGKTYALIGLTEYTRATTIKLVPSGTTARSWSVSLGDDVLMGRWRGAFGYLFGTYADYIPADAVVVRLEPLAQIAVRAAAQVRS